MAPSPPVQELNAELARRINEEARQNPASPYRDKYVGIANGQVVVVADDWDQVIHALEQVEPVASRTYCLQAGLDENEVIEIWGRA